MSSVRDLPINVETIHNSDRIINNVVDSYGFIAGSNPQFELSNGFLNKFSNSDPEFGYNGLGEVTYYRTYSRIKEDGYREDFGKQLKDLLREHLKFNGDIVIDSIYHGIDQERKIAHRKCIKELGILNSYHQAVGFGQWAHHSCGVLVLHA